MQDHICSEKQPSQQTKRKEKIITSVTLVGDANNKACAHNTYH
jgi:hypothetical protein